MRANLTPEGRFTAVKPEQTAPVGAKCLPAHPSVRRPHGPHPFSRGLGRPGFPPSADGARNAGGQAQPSSRPAESHAGAAYHGQGTCRLTDPPPSASDGHRAAASTRDNGHEGARRAPGLLVATSNRPTPVCNRRGDHRPLSASLLARCQSTLGPMRFRSGATADAHRQRLRR